MQQRGKPCARAAAGNDENYIQGQSFIVCAPIGPRILGQIWRGGRSAMGNEVPLSMVLYGAMPPVRKKYGRYCNRSPFGCGFGV